MAKKKTSKKAKGKKGKGPKAPKPTKPPDLSVPLSEAAAALQVDDKTLRRWIKKGCPSSRRKSKKGGGPKRIYVAPPDVLKWCTENSVELPGTVGAEEAPPPDPRKGPQDPNLQKPGLVGALARMQSVERVTYAAYLRSIVQKETPALTRSKQKLYLTASDALRKVEKELPGILEGRGESIPLQTAIDERVKMNMAIKQDLQTLPRKLTPLIAAMSPELDAGEVEETIAREVDDMLRHLASGATLAAIGAGSIRAPGKTDG